MIKMEFKGTNGNWMQSDTLPHWIVSDIGGDICKISNHSGFNVLSDKDLANAKLIAQSHNLLNIVRDFIDAIKSECEDDLIKRLKDFNLIDRSEYCINKILK